MSDSNPPIVAFSHIPKTGGTTLVDILRRNHGLAHLDALPRINAGLLQYTGKELDEDLGFVPWILSISGHCLRPFEDYGRHQDRLRWVTFLRDPIDRFLSQYEYQVRRYGLSEDFWSWKRKYRQDNAQVVQLAGEPDLEAAKAILETRITAFGLVERFDDSLLIIRHQLGLRYLNMAYRRPQNVSKGDLKQAIIDDYDEYEQAIRDCNELDVELYQHALNNLWPQQIESYGKNNLTEERNRIFGKNQSRLRETVNLRANKAFHHFAYKPRNWLLTQSERLFHR